MPMASGSPCSRRTTARTRASSTTAGLLADAGIPMVLVGDSLGQVVLGYETTVKVTMDEMLHHTRAVVRGTKRALVIGDMPFLSYATATEATDNAGRFMQDGGAQ